MKDHQGMKIIGIDNGYGNIKTANCCFPAGLTVHDAEPVFKDDLLVYDGRYYLIGTGHKEFKADKTGDDDYYILTLAAIARELNVYGLTDATVYLAVGLPLTWVSRQREDFKAYLTRNRELAFTFRGKAYRVEIAGVDVFPQGFAAVAGQIRDFQGVNMLCDIGNGTMNIMFINDRKPVVDRMFTEKYGTHQCMLAVRENVMRTHHATVDESIINRVLRFGTADIREDYLDAGVIPKFASCSIGIQWFRERGLWQDGSYEPRPGDLIFFDWDDEDEGQDGAADHVGIVEKVDGGIVYTVEGNSGNACRERQYAIGHAEIYGYGTPAY